MLHDINIIIKKTLKEGLGHKNIGNGTIASECREVRGADSLFLGIWTVTYDLRLTILFLEFYLEGRN